jgi:hypothetical protein
MTVVQRRQRFSGERCGGNSIFQQADEDMVAVKFNKLAWDKRIGKFLRQ